MKRKIKISCLILAVAMIFMSMPVLAADEVDDGIIEAIISIPVFDVIDENGEYIDIIATSNCTHSNRTYTLIGHRAWAGMGGCEYKIRENCSCGYTSTWTGYISGGTCRWYDGIPHNVWWWN